MSGFHLFALLAGAGAKNTNAAAQKGKKGKKNKKVKKNKPKWNAPGTKAKKKGKKEAVPEVAFVNKTPKGEKKDCSGELAKAFMPEAVEAAWDDWWAAAGYCTPDPEKAKNAKDEDKFIMVLPPPNVTGSLHLGHALMVSIEDAMARWHRMHGKVVEWVPGTDHAGIATQTRVEKTLMKEEGLTRHDLGREKFLERVWAWKEQYGGKITQQMRRMGASVDWSREFFTCDKPRNAGVIHAFKQFFNEGKIYRANRLVNWSCHLNTAISNIEVDHVEIDTKPVWLSVPGHAKDKKYEFGTLTEFAYKVDGVEGDEEVVVATTRLETMLGDSAVAVHPNDPRYKHLHGKFVRHPFNGRKLPIVCDGELVDMEFGTGCVKITPAHDANDFRCGQRHDLEIINIFTDRGAIADNESTGEFAGLMRFDARVAIQKALDEKGLFRGKTFNKMRLGICSRSSDVIEPLLKPQWWVDCKEMAAQSVEAVRSGELRLLPPHPYQKIWYHWLENIQDWCVSRQLWWGHRVPAYFITRKGQKGQSEEETSPRLDMKNWVAAASTEEAKQLAAERLGCSEDEVEVEQDEDVLDTWFSSGLLPFTAFGWPNESHPDFKPFYPGDVLETGHDILFFWVARMVMMSLGLCKKLPFSTVYLHSLVKDKEGRKMSKSLGNIIDPLEVISGCPLAKINERLKAGNLDPKEVIHHHQNE